MLVLLNLESLPVLLAVAVTTLHIHTAHISVTSAVELEGAELTYRKVASSRLSRLVAHLRIFRLFMKGKFDAYVL